MRALRWIAVLPIRFYRRWISPFTPPSCRFHPTCSAYGLEAVGRHGVLKGSLLTIWRVLRCQPFCVGGLDPVPPRGHWRSPRSPGEAESRDVEEAPGRSGPPCDDASQEKTTDS